MPSTAARPVVDHTLPQEALVASVRQERVHVRLTRPGSAEEREARLAVLGYRPCPGDRVLVQPAAGGSLYVVGVVHTARAPQLTTAAGASATVEDERIALRAADGALLAVYDAETGELELSAPQHLKLRAPGGRISHQAAVLEATAGEARWSVGSWELSAERTVERCRDALIHVEGILETRARRVRTLVDRTLELCARRTSVTSEEDTRIDGKRVLLG
jgi:hypothetical protein